MWTTQCLLSCPIGTYTSENKTLCLPCNESCSRCLSLNQCTKCSKGFYLEGETCDSKCIDGKYANNANGSCTFCDSVCETCYGPGTNDCIKCNSQKGYTFVANKICGFLNCEDGTYYDKKRLKCMSCHKACKSCKDSGRNMCIECSPRYKNFGNSDSNVITCMNCEEYDSRLYTTLDGSCKGIFS